MSVLTLERLMPDTVEFREIEAGQFPKIIDDEATLKSYYYPPMFYLNYSRTAQKMTVEEAKASIVTECSNFLRSIVPHDERVIFTIHAADIASAFVFHVEPPAGPEHGRDVFGYVHVAGITFGRTGVRVLLTTPTPNGCQWSTHRYPRKIA